MSFLAENSKSKTNTLFITFEGPECAGKTTQMRLLREYFDKSGFKYVLTREPGGTAIGEELRKIVKHYVGEGGVFDETELLLFAASRAQHVREIIAPALAQGRHVICDRFIDSTVAYQGYGRGLDIDFIEKLNKFATCGILPDLTIVLDLSPEEGRFRGLTRQETLFVEDRIESAEISFHRKVREGFLAIARKEPNRVKVLDACRNIDEIHNEIKFIVENAIRRIQK